MSKSHPSGYKRPKFDTCPVGGCVHSRVLHDVDEIPWPRIERCTVADCGCSGIVELEVAS